MKIGAPIAATAGVVAGGLYARRWATRPLPFPPPPGRFVDAGDTEVHIVERGEGEALVLIHGFGGSTFSWRELLPRLATERYVVAIDLPGFGHSARNPSLPLGHEAQAARVVAAMDHLGIERAAIAGHSMGGGVATRVAATWPERVTALALITPVDATQPPPPEARRRISERPFRIAAAMPGLTRWLTARGLRRIVYDPAFVTDEVVDGYLAPNLRPGTLACILRMRDDSLTEPLVDPARITVPTLVLSGERDTVIARQVTEALSRRIAGASHDVIARSGHLPAEEQPDMVAEALRTLLAKT